MDDKYYAITREGEDDLQHWKYIDRKWDTKKRRYKYTYRDRDTKSFPANNAADKIKNHMKDMVGYDEREAYREVDKYAKRHEFDVDHRNRVRKSILRGDRWWGKIPKTRRENLVRTSVDKKLDKAKKSYRSAKKVREKALKEYKKTPLYKLEKAKKKIDKGKKWLKKKLKFWD